MADEKNKPPSPKRQYPNPWLEGERARYEREERPLVEATRAWYEHQARRLQEEQEQAQRDEETAKAKEQQAMADQIAAAVAAAVAPPPRAQAISLKELVCGDKHKRIRGLAEDIKRDPHDQRWIDWARALLPRVHAAGWKKSSDHSLAKDLAKWFGAKK
jgi:hypothetical protein